MFEMKYKDAHFLRDWPDVARAEITEAKRTADKKKNSRSFAQSENYEDITGNFGGSASQATKQTHANPEPEGWRNAAENDEELRIFAKSEWDNIQPYYQQRIAALITFPSNH